MDNKKVNGVFDLLDKYRMLPFYQLERRADIFFAIYLSDIIEFKFNQKVNMIIPEFPVRIGTIRPPKPNNQSYKIDYLITTEENNAFIIELKTDDGSTRQEQNSYLKETIKTGYNKILTGLIKISEATTFKAKYNHLINLLLENQSLSMENGKFKINDKYSFWNEVIFIKPNKDSNDIGTVIDFCELSNLISTKYDDEMSLRFSESLLKWKSSPNS